MKLEKIFGWLLLITGILIIIWGILNSYNIFTAKQEPPPVFKMSEKEATLPQKGKTQDLQAQMEKMIGEQLKGILPLETLPKLLNLISWSIFMGILFFAGGQVAGIGIKLLKKS
jgi:hypothetical protein